MSLTRRFELFCDKLGLILQSPNTALVAFTCISFYFFKLSLGADPDLFARMAVGRLINELGYLPLQDPFAFSPKKPIWIDHEWLSGLIFYDLFRLGGDKALYLFKSLIAILTFHFLLQAQLLYSKKNRVVLAWTLICALNCSYLWTSTVRAQVFSYLFLAYVLFKLLQFRQSKKLLDLASFPLIFAAWCNLHGGFVLGFALLLVFFLCSNAWSLSIKISIIFAACFAASFFNPYPAFSLWSFLIEALSMPRPSIGEWQALSPFAMQAQVQNFVLLAGLYGFLSAGKPADTFARIVLIASAIFAYWAERFVALFMFSAIIFASGSWEHIIQTISSNLSAWKLILLRSLNCALLLIILSCGFSLFRFFAHFPSFQLDKSSYPVAALDWLRQNEKSGRLLVDFNLGSYAIWALYPNFTVSLDGRYEEVYPQTTLHLIDAALSNKHPAQEQALSILNPTHILVKKSSTSQLNSTDWKELYQDQNFLLFKHASLAPAQ